MRVNKLKIIAIFAVGIVAVFSLIFTRNFFKTNTAHGDTTQNLVVYADQLSGQVSNWSWGSSVNFSNSSPVFSGSNAISFTPGSWGGLYLHANSPITPASYTSLQFAMQTSDSVNNFTILFYDGNNQLVKSVKLSDYPGTSQNGWTVYTIPTSIMPSTLGGVALQETSGNAGPVAYIDSIQFIGAQAAPSTSSGPTAGSGSTTSIYADALASGWINWSWNSNVNFSNSNPVYQGANAISFTPTAGYGGLYIHSDKGIDTSPYLALTFAARANTNGETYAVGVYDSNNQMLHSPVALDAYGGQPVSDTWKVYTVPLSDLNASNKTIKGIMIQDTSGKTGQTLYIDQVGLTTDPQLTQSISLVPSAAPTSAPTVVPVTQNVGTTSSGNPLSGITLFNDADANPALQQQQQWQSSRPADAAEMAKIAGQPKAIWMGSWSGDIQSAVQTIVNKAASSNALPVMIAYNIPGRDCGSYSAGGSGSLQAYESWIASFAQGIGQHRAAVVLEPDALAQITCLSSGDQQQRYQMLSYAVQIFKSLGNTVVYIDAGNSSWIGASDMASRLKQASIDKADGFALNVSNFMNTGASVSYGQQVSGMVGGKHFIVDTSRNGNGPASDNAWCNPPGRALGERPTTQTGNALVDAYLWLKYPGESDGSCNGGPAAGVWYPDYALGLAQRANW